MATLTPKIQVCFSNTCKFTINDITGINSTENPNAYKNSIVPNGVEVTEWNTGVFLIRKYGSTEDLFTLTTVEAGSGFTLYPGEATPNMPLGEFTFNQPDGVYDVIYTGTLLNGHTLNTYTNTILVHCKANACIDKLASNYAKNPSSDNLDKLVLANSLFQGAIALFSCNKVQNAEKVTKMLNRICDINQDCGCN
ncbi:MAG TPA: hypothetical protein VIK77_02870 [Tissierellaceae bacterium]